MYKFYEFTEDSKKLVNDIEGTKKQLEEVGNSFKCNFKFWKYVSTCPSTSMEYLETFSNLIFWDDVFKYNTTLTKEFFFSNIEKIDVTNMPHVLRGLLKHNKPLAEKISGYYGLNGEPNEVHVFINFFERVERGRENTTEKTVTEFWKYFPSNPNISEEMKAEYKNCYNNEEIFSVGQKVHTSEYDKLIVGGKDKNCKYILINIENIGDEAEVVFAMPNTIMGGWVN